MTTKNFVLTQELVDMLVPEHERASCTDALPENGYVRPGHESPRCMRCYLLRNLGAQTDELEVALRLTSDARY